MRHENNMKGLAFMEAIMEPCSLAGKPRQVSQYAIGNSLLALQMVEHLPEVALYAPLRLAVYEEDEGKTFVAYDRFSSLLSQYQRASGGAEAGGAGG